MLEKIVFGVAAIVIIGAVGFGWMYLSKSIFASPDLGVAFGLLGCFAWGLAAGRLAGLVYSDRFDD